MQETQVWSLEREDLLKKGMAAHSNILAWRIPWTEEPGRLQSTGLQRVGLNWATKPFAFLLLKLNQRNKQISTKKKTSYNNGMDLYREYQAIII